MSKPAFKAYFFPDKQSGGYTGIVDDMPAAVSQGATIDQARDNLLFAVETVMRFQNQDEDDDTDSEFWKNILSNDKDIIVQDLNIAL